MIWIFKAVEAPSMEADAHAMDQAKTITDQISGRDQNGTPIEQTYKLFADNRADGKLQDFQVTEVDPGSPMDTYFGLKEDDVILGADHQGVRFDMNQMDDEQAARDAIHDAYTYHGHLYIQRGDDKLTLPLSNEAVNQNPAPQPAANPTTPAPAPSQTQKPLDPNGNDDQMDRLQRLSHMNPGMQ
ncbi:MAG: hypothetical protein ABSG31_13670 [Tepidisphaeraceae bacterium]